MSSSLFDRTPAPALDPAGQWLLDLLSGSIATATCIIAVAALGMAMLTGRISLRRSTQVVVGCFLLIGASSLAGQLQQAGLGMNGSGPVPVVIEPQIIVEEPLPPADYNPYAGASLRRN